MNKKVITLIVSIILIGLITFSSSFITGIDNLLIKRLIGIILNLLNGGVALIAMKINNMRLDLDIKNYKQYLWGIGIFFLLSLNIVIVPTLLGLNMVGQHTDFNIYNLLYGFFFYFFIIGPVEELIFRVYLQDTITSFFNKNKWIGVVIVAIIFGFWHLINGSLLQVLFTFIIGLVIGLSKHFIKNCKYLGLAVGHGLYDFINTLLRIFVV